MTPEQLDLRKQYESLKAFVRDERGMAMEGWTTESISVKSQPSTRWLRLRGSRPGLAVDAHYLRLNPPSEVAKPKRR